MKNYYNISNLPDISGICTHEFSIKMLDARVE